ncbi:hypothetical protein ACFL6S_12090 [Candidatus Poribacteria bacterium]
MNSAKRKKRSLLLIFAQAVGLTSTALASTAAGEEVLYNGIVLPDKWPPSDESDPRKPPPYLESPPAVIPIDVGRQLFVDDFLVESTTLARTFHLATYYEGNPVLKPDKPWELLREGGHGPNAMVYSDGVWYDPQDKLLKMWYQGNYYPRETCYATSKDGVHWDKPDLDVVPGTNIVMPTDGDRRDANTVWLDLNEEDPQQRYKMWQVMHYKPGGMSESRLGLFFSGDGIHWRKIVQSEKPTLYGERTTVFYNPFRGTWVYSVRSRTRELGRARHYQEDNDLIAGTRLVEKGARLWVGSDELDPRFPPWDVKCQLYNLDCVAYESLILGLFTVWRGDVSDNPLDRPKMNEICLGYTRDGYHWTRPDRRAFCPVSEKKGDWNYGNVSSAGGCCLVIGYKLYFYVSGRAGRPGGGNASGECSTGLATLRRDGFASMGAGSAQGELTTRPVRFNGKHMFVNADCDDGELRVEILDLQDKVIAPFSRDNCIPIKVDKTLQAVQWQGTDDLSRITGRTVKFRFYLTNGQLYAFWVSPTLNGASHGYVAAGGPGFTGHADTVGADGYSPE